MPYSMQLTEQIPNDPPWMGAKSTSTSNNPSTPKKGLCQRNRNILDPDLISLSMWSLLLIVFCLLFSSQSNLSVIKDVWSFDFSEITAGTGCMLAKCWTNVIDGCSTLNLMFALYYIILCYISQLYRLFMTFMCGGRKYLFIYCLIFVVSP